METRLSVRIVGPGVRPGKIALRDLQRIVHPLEQAIQALLPAPAVANGTGDRERNPEARLLLSKISEGSTMVELDLETDAQQTMPGLELDPIRELINGIQRFSHSVPPEAYRTIEHLASRLPPGIDMIELSCPDLGQTSLKAQVFRDDAIFQAAVSVEMRTISGRLMEVDFASGKARLQIPPAGGQQRQGEFIQIRFDDELAADMQRCARQLVSARGEAAVVESGYVRELNLQSIRVEQDDRHALWPAKLYRWPTPDELLDNVDVQDFLENIHGVDKDDE